MGSTKRSSIKKRKERRKLFRKTRGAIVAQMAEGVKGLEDKLKYYENQLRNL